jgi:hypothetical protein
MVLFDVIANWEENEQKSFAVFFALMVSVATPTA